MLVNSDESIVHTCAACNTVDWSEFSSFGTLLIIINFGLAGRLHVGDRLASAFLMVMTATLEALLVVSIFLNMLLNL